MKKVLTFLVISLFLLPIMVRADEKVKVYLFYAGGCPGCEKMEEFLTGLDDYNKTFTLEKKELYVDHVNWAQGKDYNLGVQVADAFTKAGFDAKANSTPFLVISDLFTTNSYAPSKLDTIKNVINEAYETGDKDVVGCIEQGGTNCIEEKIIETKKLSVWGIVAIAVSVVVVFGLVVFGSIMMTKKEEAK